MPPPPRQRRAPRSRDHQAAPSAPTGLQHQGTREGQRGAPPSPPPTHGQPEAGQGDGGPAPPPPGPGRDSPPPRGPQHPVRGATAAVRAAVRRVLPVSRPPTSTVPAAGRQPCAGAQGQPPGGTRTAAGGREPVQCGGRGNDEATRLGARPGGVERQTAAERPSRLLPRRAPGLSPRGGAAHRPPPPPARVTPGAA